MGEILELSLRFSSRRSITSTFRAETSCRLRESLSVPKYPLSTGFVFASDTM